MATGRNRNIAPTIPYAFLHGVDGASITAVSTALQWDHAHFINSSLRFTDMTTRVYINRGAEGMYEIDASAGMEKDTGNPAHGTIILYVNSVAAICCTADCMIGAGTQHGDAYLHTTAYLKAGDYIEIYASVDAGTATIEINTARLHMKGIPLIGWNNKFAGRIKHPFRGDEYGNR